MQTAFPLNWGPGGRVYLWSIQMGLHMAMWAPIHGLPAVRVTGGNSGRELECRASSEWIVFSCQGLLVYSFAAAKSLQSCPTLCDPIDGSPPGSPIPGILQARTLEWVAMSFSNASKWKVKVKSLSHVQLLATPWIAAHRLLHLWDFPGKSTGEGCHCLLQFIRLIFLYSEKPNFVVP